MTPSNIRRAHSLHAILSYWHHLSYRDSLVDFRGTLEGLSSDSNYHLTVELIIVYGKVEPSTKKTLNYLSPGSMIQAINNEINITDKILTKMEIE